jgi:hypothetical protein
MKDIKDMNLAELAEKVRWLEYCVNGCVIEISDRLHELNDLTRWIPVSERMPTEEDFGIDKRFRVWIGSIDSTAIFTEGRLYVWDDEAYNSGWTEYDPNNHRVAFTHWQRITPPEAKP